MVIPVGSPESQKLLLVTKTDKGINMQNVGWVRFVELKGEYGWEQ